MRVETWTCDRCGSGGNGQPPLSLDVHAARAADDIHRDLCVICLGDLVEWIDAGRGR